MWIEHIFMIHADLLTHMMAILYHYRQQSLYLTPKPSDGNSSLRHMADVMSGSLAVHCYMHIFSTEHSCGLVLWFREQSGVNWIVLVHHVPPLLVLEPETFWRLVCNHWAVLSLIIQFGWNYISEWLKL